jgi:hypothetical protein
MRRSTAVSACAVAATASAALTAAIAPVLGNAGISTYAEGSQIASLRSATLALRAAPESSRILARVGRTTEFGSATRITVVADRGDWLEVISQQLPDGVHAFVRRSAIELARRPYVLEANITRRRLIVWRWGRIVRAFPIGIGAPISPTPSGRFSITDKLRNFDPADFGCCVLALSGHQTHLPPGWRGGDQLAIHQGGGLGRAVSAGCLQASGANMRYLMRVIPLGTQIFMHR